MDYTKKIKSHTLQKLAPYSWWIQATCTDNINTEAYKILTDIDNICLILETDHNNFTELSNKVETFCKGKLNKYLLNNQEYKSIKDLTPQEQEVRRQIWDFINELKACFYLYQEGYSNLKIVKTEKYKTPDISGKKNSIKYFIEVKTLHNPREEEIRLMQKYATVKDVDRNFEIGLQKKGFYFINDAEDKFNAVNAQHKILIIFYSPSISAIIQKNESLEKIMNIPAFYKNIEIIMFNETLPNKND